MVLQWAKKICDRHNPDGHGRMGSHRRCCRACYESDRGPEAENIVNEIGVCIQKMVIYLKLMSNTIPSGDSPRFLFPGEAQWLQRLHRCLGHCMNSCQSSIPPQLASMSSLNNFSALIVAHSPSCSCSISFRSRMPFSKRSSKATSSVPLKGSEGGECISGIISPIPSMSSSANCPAGELGRFSRPEYQGSGEGRRGG